MRGHYREGRRWLDQALASGAGAPAGVRSKALNGAGCLAMNQGTYPSATALLEQSLHLRQELGDESGIAIALDNLALVAVAQSDLTRGRALHEKCLAILPSLGDRRRIGQSLNNLALVLHQQGDDARATALLEESLAIARNLGDTWNIAARLGNLAEVARQRGPARRSYLRLLRSGAERCLPRPAGPPHRPRGGRGISDHVLRRSGCPAATFAKTATTSPATTPA